MPIDFPQVTLSIIPAIQLAGVTDQRVLIPGQMISGTATPGDLIRDFPNDGSEDSEFGQASHIASMVRAFKVENKVSNLDVLPLSDAGGATAATSVITLTGTATEDITFVASIVSEKTLKRTITVINGDSITAIGDAIVAAFGDDLTKLFTIDNAVGVITSTAVNKGTLGNEYGLSIEGSIPGVTIALTAWSGGATDPTLTGILDVLGDTRYQTVLWPSNYDLTVIEDLLNARFNISNDVLDGFAIQVVTDTLANLKSYAIQNSQSIVIASQPIIDTLFFKGSATLEAPDIAAAQICAIRALRFTEGALLTNFLTTAAPSDQFGGVAIASLPYANTSIPNLPIAKPENDFSKEDQDELTNSGIGAYGPNRVFNGTIFGEMVTTYLTDIAGNPDESFKFLNTVDTISVIREFFFVNLKRRYAQTRLTDSDLIARRDMANESSIRAFCNELYNELSDETLTQKGAAAKKDYNSNLIIVVNVANGTVTIDQAPLLVSQLRAILGTIQVNFGG